MTSLVTFSILPPADIAKMTDKKKTPASTAGAEDNAGIGLLSHTKVCSIMGDEELDCRVRNGIGYTLFSMDTKEICKCIIDRE